MLTVTLDEARDRLAELVEAAARGETITIARDGIPIAKLEPAWDRARVHEAVEGLRALRERIRQRLEAEGQPPITYEEIIAWRNEGRP
jgi:prevent-host-death family protein